MNLQEFYAKLNNRVKDSDIFIDALNELMSRRVEEYNNSPKDEFAGLSSVQMHSLLYGALDESSPVSLKTDIPDEILDNMLFFRLAEEFLRIIKRDGPIKLTKTGALPRRILQELCDSGVPADWHPIRENGSLMREDESAFMRSLHKNAYLTGTARKVNGKLFLTRNGETMLAPGQRNRFFRLVVEAFTYKFNWAYNDWLEDCQACQTCFGFSLYLLSKFGTTKHPFSFYSELFLKAFPFCIEEFSDRPYFTAEQYFQTCYRIRTFSRFLEWFGLVDIEFPNGRGASATVMTNQNFKNVFDVL